MQYQWLQKHRAEAQSKAMRITNSKKTHFTDTDT